VPTSRLNPRGWWMVRTFGRNPLLRGSDRVEAVVIMLAVALLVAAAAVAGAVGAAVNASHAQAYADEAHARHTIGAMVLDSTTSPRPHTTIVKATWGGQGDQRTESFGWDHEVKPGQRIDIWVDADGHHVSAPRPPSRAVMDAVSAGVLVWLGAGLAAMMLVATARFRLNVSRYAQWEREFRSLSDGGGRTHP
jgi:hypothetical protein